MNRIYSNRVYSSATSPRAPFALPLRCVFFDTVSFTRNWGEDRGSCTRTVMSILTVMLIFALVFAGFAGFAEEKQPRSPNGPRDHQEYAEQCRVTNLWKVQLGYVNVIAFFDPSWHYSYRQAIMFELLNKRLEKSGFTGILFFVVTPSSSLPETSMENDVEARTWKEISKNMLEQEYIWGTEESQFYKLAKNNEKRLVFFRDTPELGIMEHFRASRDEVVVLDRCGKLTYHVIIPWSILYFPYVKAAILSTYKEDPCGPCIEQPLPMYQPIEYEGYNFQVNSNSKGTEKVLDVYAGQASDNFQSKNIATFSKENENHEDTDVPTMKTDLENLLSDTDNREDNENSLVNGNIASTAEVSVGQTQTEILPTISDYKGNPNNDFFKKQEGVNDDNSLFTIISAPADETNSNYKEYQSIRKDDGAGTVNTESAKSQVSKETEDLPLCIILYSPHTHQENQTLKQYTHLILKTGNSDYHDHFDSRNGVYDQQKPIAPDNLDPTTVENKRFTSDINESPGIYGEVAYYWRTTEDDEFSNQDDNMELLEFDDATMEGAETKTDDTFDNESGTLMQSAGADATDADTNNKINEDSEELVQRRLIEHYNKLVPWIHYII
ncbi:uncharacterized protein LOC116430336 isoform X1 [Nomia melanderi]|uniref:uncharacterized protein LOC116430336 isoform X1 n=1 Tax=Nomia melanderi TaxID=2448451 RepID=UPI00130409EB|nr:uncharacterized protein LOC116430336 [Nomia melanderi]